MLLPLGYFWGGWLFWGLVLLFLGRRHPAVYDPACWTPAGAGWDGWRWRFSFSASVMLQSPKADSNPL